VKELNAFYRRIDPKSNALTWLMQHERVTRLMMEIERKFANGPRP
jgi:hypothetical protein